LNLDNFARFTRVLPEPHLLVDSSGVIQAANLSAARFFDTPPARLAGTRLASLVRTPEPKVLDFLAMAAAGGQAVPGRWAVPGPDGEDRSVPVSAGVVDPAADGAAALVLIRIDPSDPGNPFLLLTRKIDELSAEIRRRMALEEERARLLRSEQAARAQAEEASRLKDDFLATLSHELRTPLNAIIGWASILREGAVGPDKQGLAIQTIERAARAQGQLVEDLLDYSRIIGGQVRLDVRSVNIAEVVEAAVETVRPTAEAKGVRIDAILDPKGGPVNGDPDRLQQVVWNLVANAIKFTGRGGRVEVRVERVNSHVEIIVADNGQGIDPEFLPHVFDRFRQADSSHSRTHGGVGLGLSIARQLVEAHAGVIHAASDGAGKGATFTVMLPLQVYQRPPSVAAERFHPTAEPPRGPGRDSADEGLAGLHILVVEDHPDSRDLLATLLQQRGARVRTAGSAAEARARLDEGLPDLILADIELPGEDGYTFLRKLRASSPADGGAVPAIAITALARRVDRMRAFDVGFQMHMAKPVDPEELVTLIRAAVRRS
jgi:signal transduction histidine kinase/ActR/RegA family two-component response regulator